MLPTIKSPEIVIGLCAAVGTDKAKATTTIVTILKQYGYNTIQFKVTDIMKSIQLSTPKIKQSPVEDRYDTHIKYANRIRELFDDNSVLSMLCCAAIRSFRKKTTKNRESYLQGHVYIFDQFKREEEIRALRQIYGRLFILVSIYSDPETRLRRLCESIAAGHSLARPSHENENAARELMKRDEEEEGVESGQRLREAFPNADVFVNVDEGEETEQILKRFFKAFFGSNNTAPTRDEYGMYIAKSAALRTLDLSRQIGAAIFSPQGEVISMGSNEVPKAGGGTYWENEADDHRDYTLGQDENERIKRALLADVVRRLSQGGYLKKTAKVTPSNIVDYVLADSTRKGSPVRETQLMDLLEFGRIIHAEMSAISDAARLGRSVKGATLYSTTFPCHICAKHIVAAGIERVVYIEPYPWPAPGSEDTELGVLMEPEVDHGEAEVHAGVQA